MMKASVHQSDQYLMTEGNDTFNIANRLQEYRPVKAFDVTYLRVES